MLKDIRLHLEKDTSKQERLEKKLARHIAETHKANINSFQRTIPSLLPYIQQRQLQSYSLFCNKFGEFNIVDYGIGRTFYGFHPYQEVLDQVKKFSIHSPYISLANAVPTKSYEDSAQLTGLDDLPAYKRYMSQPPLPKNVECLVVLGCGLGMHIAPLLQQHNIKYLIIYEPEHQYFQCSTLAISWQEIFNAAKSNNTGIFIQLEKDGRDIVADISELQSHTAIKGFHLYQHYNHPVFDSLYQSLCTRSWTAIKDKGINYEFSNHYSEVVPPWTPITNLSELHAPKHTDLFKQNLRAFEKYLPAIYKEYKDYKPRTWLPMINPRDEINLLKRSNLVTWYTDSPKQDCELNLQNFETHPNKDGLILGYSGTKLAHYLHYQFVKETEKLLQGAEDEVGALPDNVASLIMFGMGVGYQLETLLANHKVEKLFICEPNTDFFYASLFAIDWKKILQDIDESGGRIYLNIGDDGSHLFRDLLNQFYSIGPYILNETYFYQSYYNVALNTAIAQLREQLQIVISMGEYFDHAYHGISHTNYAISRSIPFLKKTPSSSLSYDTKEVPVFLVGNGPSLDFAIDTIRAHQNNAIIISCGTSLQTLYKNNIKPDFHAEIEQNRSTFDWVTRLGDFAYLKSISLISCNGIHPETCELFNNVFLAFKEGESSTVATSEVLGGENFEILKHAFPTVGNFALDIISTLGFQQIYLFGIDLGFKDVSQHHSSQSGYYDDAGEALYNYQKSNYTSIVVKGNFQRSVFTKHEFKVSRMVMEQALSKYRGECYNTSDGAKISSAMPLGIQNIILTTSQKDKSDALKSLKSDAFISAGSGDYISAFENRFQRQALIRELKHLNGLMSVPPTSKKQALALMDEQKRVLFQSYQSKESLLFYLMYGTTNYASAFLVKCLTSFRDETKGVEKFNEGLEIWKTWFNRLLNKYLRDPDEWDCSHSLRGYRSIILLLENLKHKHVTIVTDSTHFKQAFESFSDKYNLKYALLPLNSSVPFSSLGHTNLLVIYGKYADKREVVTWLDNLAGTAIPCVVITDKYEPQLVEHPHVSQALMPGDVTQNHNLPTQCSDSRRGTWPIMWCNLDLDGAIIIPKYRICSDNRFPKVHLPDNIYNDYYAYEEETLIVFSPTPIENDKRILSNGDRLKSVEMSAEAINHIHTKIDRETHLQLLKGLYEKFPFLHDKDSIFE